MNETGYSSSTHVEVQTDQHLDVQNLDLETATVVGLTTLAATCVGAYIGAYLGLKHHDREAREKGRPFDSNTLIGPGDPAKQFARERKAEVQNARRKLKHGHVHTKEHRKRLEKMAHLNLPQKALYRTERKIRDVVGNLKKTVES